MPEQPTAPDTPTEETAQRTPPGGRAAPLVLPKGAEEEVRLITGFTVRLRSMTVRDMNRFSDPALIRSNRAVDTVIRDCCVEVIDPGPYKFRTGLVPKESQVDWGKVAKVDREYLFIHLRRITLGDDFDFDAVCNSPSCGATIPWHIECSNLPYTEMPIETVKILSSDGALEFKLPVDGRMIKHKVMLGSDEMFLATKSDASTLMLDMLNLRIVEVEGVNRNDKRRWLQHLSLKDQYAFLGEVNRAEGGVDLSFEVECHRCFKEVVVNLLLDAPFFLGRQTQKKSGASSRKE